MRNFLSMPSDERVRCLAIGKFDGMHLAHRELFKHLGAESRLESRLESGAPESSALLCIKDGVRGIEDSVRALGEITPQLTPHKQRHSPFELIGVEFSEIMQWSGEYFLQRLCEKFTRLEKLVVGYDFCFGKDRAYSAQDLARLFGGEVVIVPEFCLRGQSVHSSAIKDFLLAGKIPEANAMLGRLYEVEGSIVSGQNLGAKLLYATLNLCTQGYVLPQNGVYASFTQLGGANGKTNGVANGLDNGLANGRGRMYQSVSFVGNRLSTDGKFSIESHILDEDFERCENENVARLYFVEKIRDNMRFEDLGALKGRISQDIEMAKKILDSTKRF